jgi:hypothetical protein
MNLATAFTAASVNHDPQLHCSVERLNSLLHDAPVSQISLLENASAIKIFPLKMQRTSQFCHSVYNGE